MVTVPLLLALSLAAGSAAASDGDAWVTAEDVRPGQDVDLVFEVPPPEAAEVTVEERVTCTVTFPDGTERSPCEAAGSLVETRTPDSGPRVYVFEYQAPSTAGAYEVHFEANATASVPLEGHEATTTFEVHPAEAPSPADQPPGADDPDAPEGPEDPDGPGDAEAPDGDDASGEDPQAGQGGPLGPDGFGTDAARAAVSTGLAASVIVTGLVGTRFPLGGSP